MTRTDALPQTEAQFEAAVIEYAQRLAFRVAHFRPGRTERGWRTPVAADGAGYPDLTICGHGRLIFAELKAERGRVRESQREWLEALADAGAEIYVWRPSSWPEIEKILARENG